MAKKLDTIRHQTGTGREAEGNRSAGIRGTGALRKATRRALLIVLAALLPLFPALAAAAPALSDPRLGVGIASLTLLVMLVFVAAMWQRVTRQIRRSNRPRWEDWG